MPKLLSALKETLSVSADLIQLKDILPWITGLLVFLGGISFDRSLLEIILLLVVSMIIAWFGLGFFRANRKITAWYNQDAYQVWIASWLWINCVPRSARIDETSPAYSSLQKIKAAIQTGKITVISGDGGMRSYVARDELKKLALDKGDRPNFLFHAQMESNAKPIGAPVDEAELTRAKAELAKQERLRHKQEIAEGKSSVPSREHEKVAVDDKQITYIQTATQITNITYNYNVTQESPLRDSVDDSSRPRTAAPQVVKGYAAVKFDPNNMELHKSTAVSSITNLGRGQFGVAFVSPIDHPQFTTSTPEASCVAVNPNYATIKIEGHPSLIEIRVFESSSKGDPPLTT